MKGYRIEVESITPLVIAGANPYSLRNETLRPPSLRGMMRWWFRAIMGGFLSSISDLNKLEKKVFGGTKQSSPVIVKSENISVDKGTTRSLNLSSALRYLWFSITFGGEERRRYFEEGSTFAIQLFSKEEDPLKLALDCLWLTLYLGGIGTRSRRGMGNLKVIQTEGEFPYSFESAASDLSSLQEYMEDTLECIFNHFLSFAVENDQFDLSSSPAERDFCILSKKTAEISFLNQSYHNEREGLETVGEIYSNYRRTISNVQERGVFGLPIIKRGGKVPGRKSSPLSFGVLEYGGSYAVRIVKFFTSISGKHFDSKESLKQHLNSFDNKVDQKVDTISVSLPNPEELQVGE